MSSSFRLYVGPGAYQSFMIEIDYENPRGMFKLFGYNRPLV
jgi:hypothetical protein